MKRNVQVPQNSSKPTGRDMFTSLRDIATSLGAAIRLTFKRDRNEPPVVHTTHESAVVEQIVKPNDVVEQTAKDPRARRRSYNEKVGHTSKREALQQARIIVNDYQKPAWVYKDNGLFYASSHGFDITRRPDLTLTQAQVDLLQKEKSMTESGDAPEMEPSVVARFGFNGRFFQQCGRYLDPVDVGEWIAVQESPAVFISIPSEIGNERMGHIDRIRRRLYDTHGIITSYRWVSIDTVVLAIKNQSTGMHPRVQVENPWWLHRALNRPNAQVFKTT